MSNATSFTNRTLFIIFAVVAVVIILLLILLFVYDSGGGGGTPAATNLGGVLGQAVNGIPITKAVVAGGAGRAGGAVKAAPTSGVVSGSVVSGTIVSGVQELVSGTLVTSATPGVTSGTSPASVTSATPGTSASVTSGTSASVTSGTSVSPASVTSGTSSSESGDCKPCNKKKPVLNDLDSKEEISGSEISDIRGDGKDYSFIKSEFEE